MKLKVIVHEAEEGGYWAEVPSIPGCATQGETFDELLSNLYEAVEGCLSGDVKNVELTEKDKVLRNCRVKAISGKDFAKLLEKKGWVLRRTQGSHHIYVKEGNPARISDLS